MKNYYNLSVADVKRLKVGDRSQIGGGLFTRDDDMGVWYASGECSDGSRKIRYYLGIYDSDAREYPGKFRFAFYGPEGAPYMFRKFYNQREITAEAELAVQEKFLAYVNQMINDGVLVFPSTDR